MFYFISDERPAGWVNLSNANDWEQWLRRNIPIRLNADIRDRLTSNLKHILVGLELKKALISPHVQGGADVGGVLFEPYFQNLIFEYCVGTYSIIEGLGAAQWLDQNDGDGAAGGRIRRDRWRASLCAFYDANGVYRLENDVRQVAIVRDKMHQDEIGIRTEIDWHALDFDAAFIPADRAIQTILRQDDNLVPGRSNLPAPHVRRD